MTESCRGWIGDEEEDDAEDEEENEKEEVVREAEEVKEVKPKVKVERKKRKNVQLEDMAVRNHNRITNIFLVLVHVLNAWLPMFFL